MKSHAAATQRIPDDAAETFLPPAGEGDAVTILRALFKRCAIVRAPRHERRDEGWKSYKKGHEVRLPVPHGDARRVVKMVKEVGLRAGKPYRKSSGRTVVPVYGADALRWFRGSRARGGKRERRGNAGSGPDSANPRS
jgi:hypothetical protein